MSTDLYTITEELLTAAINQGRPEAENVNVLADYDLADEETRKAIKERMVKGLRARLSEAGYGPAILDGLPQFINDAIEQKDPNPLSRGRIRNVADQITEAVMRANREVQSTSDDKSPQFRLPEDQKAPFQSKLKRYQDGQEKNDKNLYIPPEQRNYWLIVAIGNKLLSEGEVDIHALYYEFHSKWEDDAVEGSFQHAFANACAKLHAIH